MRGMLQAGERAPKIELLDLDGKARRPLDSGGGARGSVLLVFYKDTCPTCRYTLPFVERAHRELGPRGARIIAVSQDGAERSRAFASELGISFPILVDDPAYEASRAYGLQIVPSLFLVSADGAVRSALAGFSRGVLAGMAADLAGSIGAAAPVVFPEGEPVLETKPG